MRGADFFYIHYRLLLNFAFFFHVSNMHFAKECVDCEQHHLFTPS